MNSSSPITVVCGAKSADVISFTRAGGMALSQEATKAAVDTAKERAAVIFQQFF